MVNFEINYLGVIVASLASFFYGWIWYGPLFGSVWAKENKIKMEKKPNFMKLGYHFLTNFVMVLCFSFILGGDLLNKFVLAIVIWVGFLFTTRLGSMIWMKQSWKLFFMDVSYHIINLVLIVLVLNFF